MNPLRNAAWRTANATGALSYMSYDEAQRFAVAYETQERYEDAVTTSFQEYELLGTYTAGIDSPTLSPQDAATAIPDVRRTTAYLKTVSDIGRGTLVSYKDALE